MKNLIDKMRRISIIESAQEELKDSIDLSQDIRKELREIGIQPEEFIRRFQEIEDGY